jgi:hypothetical protein
LIDLRADERPRHQDRWNSKTHKSMNVCDQRVTDASHFTMCDTVTFFEFVSIVFLRVAIFFAAPKLAIGRLLSHFPNQCHIVAIAMPDR